MCTTMSVVPLFQLVSGFERDHLRKASILREVIVSCPSNTIPVQDLINCTLIYHPCPAVSVLLSTYMFSNRFRSGVLDIPHSSIIVDAAIDEPNSALQLLDKGARLVVCDFSQIKVWVDSGIPADRVLVRTSLKSTRFPAF